MGDAQRGDDALYFYAANLGRTRRLAVTDAAASQLPDADGPLTPGRYLLFIDDLTPPGKQKVWVRTGKWEKGKALAVTPDVPHFPFSLTGIVTLEINVRKGDNDQVAAITNNGGANLYITQISRGA